MSSNSIDLAPIKSSEKSQLKGYFFTAKLDVHRWLNQFFLVSCFGIITLISAADTWLAAANEMILNEEANPICAWLIQLAPENCSYFIAAKICGTLLVTSVLYTLVRAKYRHARLVIVSVTLFQIGLLAHLWLSDPLVDGWLNFHALFSEKEPSLIRVMFLQHV